MLQRFLFQIQEMGFFDNAKTVISYSKTQTLADIELSIFFLKKKNKYCLNFNCLASSKI